MTLHPFALAEVFVAEDASPRKPPRRVNRPKNLTLTPRAREALDALAARPGSPGASAEASAAILARAEMVEARNVTHEPCEAHGERWCDCDK